MKVKEFRTFEAAIYRAIERVRGCHLEELQDAVADALDEIAQALGELEDVFDLEDD